MTEADFTGFERGVLGSTAENLSSLDYQIQKDIYTAYRKAGIPENITMRMRATSPSTRQRRRRLTIRR